MSDTWLLSFVPTSFAPHFAATLPWQTLLTENKQCECVKPEISEILQKGFNFFFDSIRKTQTFLDISLLKEAETLVSGPSEAHLPAATTHLLGCR